MTALLFPAAGKLPSRSAMLTDFGTVHSRRACNGPRGEGLWHFSSAHCLQSQ